MSVSRLENEGFGFVIISSVSRAGSTIGRIIPGEEHVLKLLSCTCQVCSLQGFLVTTKKISQNFPGDVSGVREEKMHSANFSNLRYWPKI